MVYVLYAPGLEEIEAVTISDILRRAQIPMKTCGVGGTAIQGAHGLVLQADIPIEQLDPGDMTALVLPGGMGGVEAIEASRAAMATLQFAVQRGITVAAICAAPTILGKRGMLDDRMATCYPGMEGDMGKAVLQPDAHAVVDGCFITGQAPGAAMDFALALVQELKDKQTADTVARFLVYDR